MSEQTDHLSLRHSWVKHVRETYQLPALLSVDDLKKLGITFTNVYLLQLEARGKFPRRIAITTRSTKWCCEEVLNWAADRVFARERLYAERAAAVRPLTGDRQAAKAET